jgi:hypothetical protein
MAGDVSDGKEGEARALVCVSISQEKAERQP